MPLLRKDNRPGAHRNSIIKELPDSVKRFHQQVIVTNCPVGQKIKNNAYQGKDGSNLENMVNDILGIHGAAIIYIHDYQ